MARLRKLQFFVAEFLIFFSMILASPAINKKERVPLPSFVKICRRSDPQLNVCARNSLNSFKERLQSGIPELFIPPLDPLIIPEIKMDQDTGAVYLHSTYKNIQIRGLSNFTLNDLIIDTAKTKVSLSMSFSKLSMDAVYVMDGKIMMMPLVGEGAFSSNFTDVELDTVIYGQQYKKHGRTFVRVKDLKVRYQLRKAQIRLENLFNGDKKLGDRMNLFLNENWESLSEEIRPLMENAIADVIRASTVKIFEKYSYDDLLPE